MPGTHPPTGVTSKQRSGGKRTNGSRGGGGGGGRGGRTVRGETGRGGGGRGGVEGDDTRKTVEEAKSDYLLTPVSNHLSFSSDERDQIYDIW